MEYVERMDEETDQVKALGQHLEVDVSKKEDRKRDGKKCRNVT